MRCFAGTCSRSNKTLCQRVKLALEKRVAVIGMRSKSSSVNLTLTNKKVTQHRDSDGSPDVTHEVANARNLIELISRDAYIVQSADGDKDQWKPNDLENAEDHDHPPAVIYESG